LVAKIFIEDEIESKRTYYLKSKQVGTLESIDLLSIGVEYSLPPPFSVKQSLTLPDLPKKGIAPRPKETENVVKRIKENNSVKNTSKIDSFFKPITTTK
jgi:hypothetical protein